MNERKNIRTDEEIKDYLQLWNIDDKTQILIDTAREFEEQYYLHCPKCEADVSVFYYYDKLKHRV